MLTRNIIAAFIVGSGLIFLIIELVRQRKLREEYSQLWFATGLAVLILIVWSDLLGWLSHLIGAVSQISTIFFFAFIFLMLISLHFSIVISKLTNQLKNLAQEHALLRSKFEALHRENHH